ncbi:MAG TPA: hypothetical protein VMB49_09420 [Acidobacteriaceae bacterium]|nr:hypothetical protein [Acidobacteriaceae bacterium]
MKDRILVPAVLAVLMTGVVGCKVKVNKSADGGSDNVKIATPFGGIDVNQDRTSAADLGLPAYPGAVQQNDGDGGKSAKVDMGFGSFRMRVRVVHYGSQDSRDQVMAFYRKALTQYGNVIECADGKPVGTPSVTWEGLTCDASGHDHTPARVDAGEIQLKAGSSRHQHIVAFSNKTGLPTDFTMIALDLPHGFEPEQKGTN